MRWAEQLVKLARFEVETLQARLAQIAERRTEAEMKLAVLTAQGEAELALAGSDPTIDWRLGSFTEALKIRKAHVQAEIDQAAAEETGARDALSEAFQAMKKYEQIAENARLAAVKAADRREGAILDEMGLRRASGR